MGHVAHLLNDRRAGGHGTSPGQSCCLLLLRQLDSLRRLVHAGWHASHHPDVQAVAAAAVAAVRRRRPEALQRGLICRGAPADVR